MGEDTTTTEAPSVESGAETNAGVMTVDDLAASFVERVEGEDANEAPESEAADMTDELKRIPRHFRRSGWWYTELRREGDVGIYQQFSDPDRNVPSGVVAALIRRKKEGRFADGRVLPAQEVFPGQSKIGPDGNHYMQRDGSGLELAEKKFQELLAKRCPRSVDVCPIRRAKPKSRGEDPEASTDAE